MRSTKANMALTRFKIVLVGSEQTGKSAYVNSALGLAFNDNYVPTLGVNVHPVVFNTNYGHIIVDFWDTAGQDAYYLEAQGCLVFMDDRPGDAQRAPLWQKRVQNVSPNVKSIVVYSRTDMGIGYSMLDAPAGAIAISTRTGFNVREPIIRLLRLLTNRGDLVIL